LAAGWGAQNDPLFQFKSGFSPARASFYTWRYIVNAEKYSQLCSRWQQINRIPPESMQGFFPAYRKVQPPPVPVPQQVCA
jgi:hypothetical protein